MCVSKHFLLFSALRLYKVLPLPPLSKHPPLGRRRVEQCGGGWSYSLSLPLSQARKIIGGRASEGTASSTGPWPWGNPTCWCLSYMLKSLPKVCGREATPTGLNPLDHHTKHPCGSRGSLADGIWQGIPEAGKQGRNWSTFLRGVIVSHPPLVRLHSGNFRWSSGRHQSMKSRA